MTAYDQLRAEALDALAKHLAQNKVPSADSTRLLDGLRDSSFAGFIALLGTSKDQGGDVGQTLLHEAAGKIAASSDVKQLHLGADDIEGILTAVFTHGAAPQTVLEDPKVSWTHADLTTFAPPAGSFDLVSALYFPLPRTADKALDGLLAAVAPGGTLLVGSHDLADAPHHSEFDPHDFYQPEEIAERLDDTWTVLVKETRPRVSAAPPGTEHINDVVLKARKKL